MKRISQIIFRGMMILFLILAMPISGVAAQTGCDSIIVDDAGVFGGQTSGIQKAIDDLAAYAEVRVITTQSYGNSTLDAYVSNIRQQCPSWQATDGGFKNNLIVFAISYDDQDTGIFYGNQWKDPLDANWTRIVADYMNPRFGDGDFAGGFEAGIYEVSRLVDLKIHPPAPITGNGPITIDQRPPRDLSGLYRFLTIALILFVLGALAFFGYQAYMRWNKDQEGRKRAQQRAKIKKQSLTSAIAQWNPSIQAVETDILGLKDTVDETVITRLTSMVREAQVAFEKMLRHYDGLDSSAGDPDVNGQTVGQYDVINNAYDAVLDLMDEAQTELAQAVEACDDVKDSADRAPEALVEADKELEALKQAVVQMTEQGFTIETSAQTPIIRFIELARGHMEKRRPDLAFDRAMEAAGLAESLTTQIRELPNRHKAVAAFLEALPGEIKKLKAKVEKGRQLFDAMDDVYPAEPLAPIMGNGTEAEKRIRALEDILDDLADMIKKQQYDKAEKLIERAVKWMEEIDSFMRSITSLNESLEQAAKAMQSELDAAAADVMKAHAFLTEHKGELEDEHFEALKSAEVSLRQALREMDKVMPNPIRVVKLAKTANEGADAVLVKARQDAEQIVRLRVKAETAMREATRLVNKANEYIEDHSGDVDSNAKANLRSAKQNLATAIDAGDLERRIAFAEGAQEKARHAYDEAKDDVQSAQEEDDDSGTSVSWGNSTPVYHTTTRRETTSTWSAPTPRSNQSGGSLSWGSSSQRGSSISMPKSTMSGGSKKW